VSRGRLDIYVKVVQADKRGVQWGWGGKRATRESTKYLARNAPNKEESRREVAEAALLCSDVTAF